MTPNFVNGLFVALGKTVHFAPWDRFFDFSFMRQKVFPHPTVGAPSASNSPSALSARAGLLYNARQENLQLKTLLAETQTNIAVLR